jgi:hypothetical protein
MTRDGKHPHLAHSWSALGPCPGHFASARAMTYCPPHTRTMCPVFPRRVGLWQRIDSISTVVQKLWYSAHPYMTGSTEARLTPASSSFIALLSTSKAMRTAVEEAAVMQARRGVPRRPRLLDKLNSLNTVQGDCTAIQQLRLGKGQALAEVLRHWQRHCASTPRLRRWTSATMAWERAEVGRWRRRHCASSPRLRRSTLAGIA